LPHGSRLEHAGRRLGGLPPVAWAALLAATHAASFLDPQRAILWDQRFYTYFAFLIASGQVPYRDFFDNKTPLAIVMGAGADRAGSMLGIDPLLAIRAGELAVVAASGLAAFAILRRLYAGSLVAGWIGLLAHCGFLLLGAYPAIGVLPKTRMALFAALAALCVDSRRWVAAGACAALAFLDWQVGGLALLGVFAAALPGGPGRRGRLARSALGAALALAPFALWLAACGALDAAWRQAVLSLLGSGEAAAGLGFGRRFARILLTVRNGCGGHLWLVGVGLAGLVVFPRLSTRRWLRGRGACAVMLAVYAYGMLGFKLIDFQSYGDLYPALHALALFAGVALCEAVRRTTACWLRRRRSRPGRRAARHVVPAAALAGLALLARPVLHGGFSPPGRPEAAHPGASLDDQREVVRQALALDAAATAFVGSSELLYLARRPNPVPFAYWNRVTYRYYRVSPGEGSAHTLRRLLTERGIHTLVFAGPVPAVLARPGDRALASRDGTYEVTIRRVRPVRVREEPDAGVPSDEGG
jgi:hypothetical protein